MLVAEDEAHIPDQAVGVRDGRGLAERAVDEALEHPVGLHERRVAGEHEEVRDRDPAALAADRAQRHVPRGVGGCGDDVLETLDAVGEEGLSDMLRRLDPG